MNTMTQLLVSEIHHLRIAELHAEADARRRAHRARDEDAQGRGWNLSGLFRLVLPGRRAARPF